MHLNPISLNPTSYVSFLSDETASDELVLYGCGESLYSEYTESR